MIETPDKKRFFVNNKCYTKILNFANTFNYEISKVKLHEGEALDLKELAQAITAQNDQKYAKFEVIETLKKRKRRN